MIRDWLRTLRERRVRKLLEVYEAQTSTLEQLMIERGHDVFVAPLESITVEGELKSWTSWTQDVPAMLPLADFIGVTDCNGRRMLRRRSDIENLFGRFVIPGHRPTRLRTPARFPEGATWDALQRRPGLQGFDYLAATPSPRPRARPR